MATVKDTFSTIGRGRAPGLNDGRLERHLSLGGSSLRSSIRYMDGPNHWKCPFQLTQKSSTIVHVERETSSLDVPQV